MSISKNIITPCEYLFAQTVDDVFQLGIKNREEKIEKMDQANEKCYTSKLNGLKQLKKKEGLINQYLDMMMEANIYLLSNYQEAFSLIDPRALNNQCHLYTLLAIQICKDYANKSEDEKREQSEENSFLHLSIFLGYASLNNSDLIVQTVLKTLKILAEKRGEKITNETTTGFKAFFTDSQQINFREKASLKALNGVFEKLIKNTFYEHYNKCETELESSFYHELHKMSQLNELKLNYDHNHKKYGLYTLPKLAGVAYLVDEMAKTNLTLVVKLKVVTKNGSATIVESTQKIEDKKAPVMVFEALVTDESYTFMECFEQEKKCPNSYFAIKNKIHKSDKSCFLCEKASLEEEELKPYLNQLQLAMKSPKKMLYALGTDFIIQNQKDFRTLFEENETYPILSKIFKEGIQYLENVPFNITHVHIDSALHGIGSGHMCETSSKNFLEERGLI